MDFNAVSGALPLIAAIVGVASGTVTVLVHLIRGYRHVTQRRQHANHEHVTSATGDASPVSHPLPESQPHEHVLADAPAAPAESRPAGDAESAHGIRTPDQRLRVFISSTLQELADERSAARQAVGRLRLAPVMFELGARPHPPRSLYRAYLAQSDIFIGIYWQRYGWVAPGEDVSGLEDEYRLSGTKPKLIYIKTPADQREPRLVTLLDRVRADDHVSYKSFRTPSELRRLISDDLAVLLTERFALGQAGDIQSPAHANQNAVTPPPVTGNVTFLFSDVEGSTPLLERNPGAATRALERQRELLQKSVETHNGVVFESVGDALHSAFARPTDAVAAALEGQRALFAEAWGEAGPVRARMAIHTGEVDVRSDGHYFGAPLARATRLMALAHGGQVLLSATTAALVETTLPVDSHLRDLGLQLLKDLSRPEHVYQFCHPTLPSEFAALNAEAWTPNNLPLEVTSFVGRDAAISDIERLMQSNRLLTLVGVGGVGKTRLAIQLGNRALGGFPDGVWLIDLAALTEPDLVAQTVASAASVQLDSGRSALETLVGTLAASRTLLLLDNCEHLLAACAQLAEALLRRCSQVHILATSREPLNVAGETVWRVAGLAVPQGDRPLPLAQLEQLGSIQLFVARAGSIVPNFVLAADNAQAIAAICNRLDGLPLAIELAAARIRSLSAQQIATRLDNRMSLLTGGSRTAQARQQTLRATIDWSYELLPPAEQALFKRLSVFAGGWTLEAAEAICGVPPVEVVAVLEVLTSLIDKSLVDVGDRSDSARYRLLESLREYAAEKLEADGSADATRDRHAAWYLALAETAEPNLRGVQQTPWRAILERDHDNLRAALAWTSQRQDVASGLRLAGALWEFWREHGHLAEARKWLGQELTIAGDDASDTLLGYRAKAFHAAAAAAGIQGDYAEADAFETRSLALWQQLGDQAGIANALNNLANLAQERGEYETSSKLQEQSLALRRELNDSRAIGWSLSNLGWIRHLQGDHERAAALYREALEHSREARDQPMLALTLLNLADTVRRQGDANEAMSLFKESLTLLQQLGQVAGDSHVYAGAEVAEALEGLARLLVDAGEDERAAQLLGAAGALRDRLHAPVPQTQRADCEGCLAEARAALPSDRFDAAFGAGQAMLADEAIQFALACELTRTDATSHSSPVGTAPYTGLAEV